MVLAVQAADVELEPESPRPDRVLAGNPVTTDAQLVKQHNVRYGVWQIMPGRRVEVAPTGMFVVLSGRATVAVDGGPTLELVAGTVCVWDGGERTVWTVHETLRKVWCIAGQESAP